MAKLTGAAQARIFLSLVVAFGVAQLAFSSAWTLAPPHHAGSRAFQYLAPLALGNDDNHNASLATAPSICVIVRTAQRDSKQALLTLTASLVTAANLWRASPFRMVFVDVGSRGARFHSLAAVVQGLNQLFGPIASLSPRTRDNTAPLYPAFARDDHGHVVVDHVMEDWQAECDVFVVTRGDNVYGIEFFKHTLPEILSGKDMVLTHWVDRDHVDDDDWRRRDHTCGPWRRGKFQEMTADFRPHCLDAGAVVFRSNLLRRTALRFIVDDLRLNVPMYEHGANGKKRPKDLTCVSCATCVCD